MSRPRQTSDNCNVTLRQVHPVPPACVQLNAVGLLKHGNISVSPCDTLNLVVNMNGSIC